MAKIPIAELSKELVCIDHHGQKGCGWTGLLGQTIGPNQERNFMLETDKKGKDHLFWAVYYNYFCPDCFDQKKRKGNIVKRTLEGKGKADDKWMRDIANMDDNAMNAIKAKLNL